MKTVRKISGDIVVGGLQVEAESDQTEDASLATG